MLSAMHPHTFYVASNAYLSFYLLLRCFVGKLKCQAKFCDSKASFLPYLKYFFIKYTWHLHR